MNKQLLYQYINRIKKEDIIRYGLKEDMVINKDDLDIIYNYLKNDYQRILNNPQDIINELKDKVSNKVYIKILALYDKYKDMLDKIR